MKGLLTEEDIAVLSRDVQHNKLERGDWLRLLGATVALQEEIKVLREQAACPHVWEVDANNQRRWFCSCGAVHPRYRG